MGTFRRRNMKIAYRPRLSTLKEEMREAIRFQLTELQANLDERGAPPLPTRRSSVRKKRKPAPKAKSAREAHEAHLLALAERLEALTAKKGDA
jgi:hypothetical protein